MNRALLVLGLAVALGPAPAAQAGTVAVGPSPPCDTLQSKYGQCEPAPLVFEAAPGEANRVSSEWADGEIAIRDLGARLQAGSGCRQMSDHEARCTAYGTYLTMSLGDRDDLAEKVSGSVDGGPGDDVLTGVTSATGGPGNDRLTATPAAITTSLDGGAGDDTLVGGDGGDWLYGGAGADVLRGGEGPDTLVGDGSPAAPASAAELSGDLLDGGGGEDIVSYAYHPAGVVVDLATGDNGRGAEGDVLLGIENVAGSAHADDLRGDEHANDLVGGSGRDVLHGAGGDDQLTGGPGRDIGDGGAGDDLIDLRSGWDTATLRLRRDVRGEPVACGDGADRVLVLDDRVAVDCELIDDVAMAVPRVRSRSVAVRLLCPVRQSHGSRRCRGEVGLYRIGARKPFARRAFSHPRGGGWVRLRLRAAAPSRFAIRVVTRVTGGPEFDRWRVERPR